MAIGISFLFGIALPFNFDAPYKSGDGTSSCRAFCATISIFRSAATGACRLRTYVNMIITMTLGGLWHGASWTFVIWGVLHGVGVAFVHFSRDFLRRAGFKSEPRWVNIFGLVLTFHFVTLLWVFFRAPSFDKARAMLTAAFAGGGWNITGDVVNAQSGAVLLIGLFLALHAFDDHRMIKLAIRRIRPEIVLPLLILLWALAMTISHGSSTKFIYSTSEPRAVEVPQSLRQCVAPRRDCRRATCGPSSRRARCGSTYAGRVDSGRRPRAVRGVHRWC
jgi:alginate O-acetyltransferase complex protein AlgI